MIVSPINIKSKKERVYGVNSEYFKYSKRNFEYPIIIQVLTVS